MNLRNGDHQPLLGNNFYKYAFGKNVGELDFNNTNGLLSRGSGVQIPPDAPFNYRHPELWSWGVHDYAIP